MKLIFLPFAFLSLTAAAAMKKSLHVVERAQVTVNSPSFLSLMPNRDPLLPPYLLISSFGSVGFDHIYRMKDTRNPFTTGYGSVEELSDAIVWPNEVRHLDYTNFGLEGYLVSSGFLVPWKSTGSVSFLDMSGQVTNLTKNKFAYFYHRAVFADVTGTGRQDILTARARLDAITQDGELVWLQRPKHPLEEPWKEVVLTKGPDMHFRVLTDQSTKQIYILAAEFIGKKIGLYWINSDQSVGGRVIDDGIGPVFDLDFYDLNNDGKPELLVTNHEREAEKSGVFAYEMPDDLKKGHWLRHTLLTGMETRQEGLNQASPGAAKAFAPDLLTAGQQKPWIVVSGDGSQRLHLLIPESESYTDWNYRESILLDAKSTVGEPIVHDFDGDHLADIVVPAYDANKLYFLSVLRRE